MAKELPYFKFEPNEWENGNIQILSREHKGLFIDLCCMYWSRLGDVPYKLAVQKLCAGNATALDSLCEESIIALEDGQICIDFLNEQLDSFNTTSNQNRQNAKEGWRKRRLVKDLSERNASASDPQSESDAIRGEKRREEKRKEEKKKEVHPPDLKEFLEYAIEKCEVLNYNYCEQKTKGKFLAWQENNWVNGNNRKIKNWKTSLLNTLPHIQKEKGSAQKENGLDVLREFNRRAKENEHLNTYE